MAHVGQIALPLYTEYRQKHSRFTIHTAYCAQQFLFFLLSFDVSANLLHLTIAVIFQIKYQTTCLPCRRTTWDCTTFSHTLKTDDWQDPFQHNLKRPWTVDSLCLIQIMSCKQLEYLAMLPKSAHAQENKQATCRDSTTNTSKNTVVTTSEHSKKEKSNRLVMLHYDFFKTH